jgi:hypothetical protein
MWHLKMAERGGEWVTIGSYETVASATRKLIELEGYTSYGVFFDIYIEIGPGAHSETEAFGHLEHTGKNTRRRYVVKRIQH